MQSAFFLTVHSIFIQSAPMRHAPHMAPILLLQIQQRNGFVHQFCLFLCFAVKFAGTSGNQCQMSRWENSNAFEIFYHGT